MDRSELTDEYLSKFPDTLVACIKSKDKHVNQFLDNLEGKFEDTIVYRGIHREDLVHEDDFLGNYEEAQLYKRNLTPNSVKYHAVSVFDDCAMLKKSLIIPNPERPMMAIAYGKMRCEFGPATFKKGDPHHNWYIFKDCPASVANEFEILKLD